MRLNRKLQQHDSSPLVGTDLDEALDLGITDSDSTLVPIDETVSTLPLHIRTSLETLLRSGFGCPHVFEKSGVYGHVEWHLNNTNTANARTAYRQLGQDHSSNKGEFKMPTTTLAWLTNLRVLCGDRWYLNAHQLLLARELGIIDSLPELSTDRISDLNKEDVFVKLLAISQLTWLCIQLSKRLLTGNSTTQLELMTMGYALCSVVAYCLLLDRPKDVQTVVEVKAVRHPTPQEMSRISSVGPMSYGLYRSGTSIQNNAFHCHESGLQRQLSASLAMITYGSLHFAAWNSEFPTPLEARLWRHSTLLTTTGLPAIFVCQFFCIFVAAAFHMKPAVRHRMLRLSVLSQFYIFGPLFIAARAFILMEVVRSLGFQPPESYKSTWAAYIPHVG